MLDENNIKPKIYTVSELNFELRQKLETGFPDIWLEGEVSNFYFHNQKHMYFDLKDENSKIRSVLFQQNNRNMSFRIEEGLHVLARGYLSVYEKRGEYQFIVQDIRPVGVGSLIMAFQQLKEKLEKLGYFEPGHKKKIPLLPEKIGLATSIGGAVLRDIISVLRRRFAGFNLIIKHVNVQGPGSSHDICQAIRDLSEFGVDVVIIARGGGSLEDLWAFNTEEVATGIYNCRTPVISAVGHQTDYTIADFVADCRAATPSVAAEIVIINREETAKSLIKINARMKELLEGKIRQSGKKLLYLIDRKVFKKPATILDRYRIVADDIGFRVIQIYGRVVERKKHKLAKILPLIDRKVISGRIISGKMRIKNMNIRVLSNISHIAGKKKNKIEILLQRLDNNNPAAILNRGFTVIYEDSRDKVISSVKHMKPDQVIRIIARDGSARARILDRIIKMKGRAIR
ncbi:MAG: exodeoxyribonuclease VII large subunit [Actinobacteria bacterium]|nr:exodeoxyribonuclease VII large subunit [Actinomycetota bacterium]